MHLFEFGDLPWFPQTLRDIETAYLVVAYRETQIPQQWAERIATVLKRGRSEHLLDLCAGAGGPMPQILDSLEQRGFDVHATLTDLRPSREPVQHPRIKRLTDSVDATLVSPKLDGVRTMFSAFHHFRPPVAKAILRDAYENRRTICIFESGSGTTLGVLTMLVVPMVVLLFMTMARPFRWSTLLFTYVIPIMPFIIFWDGLVSMLRTYSPEEMRRMTAEMKSPDYVWETGRIRVRGVPDGLPYLIGRPK